MINTIRKFFRFCQEDCRKKFQLSIVLGIFLALFDMMKIPACYVMLSAVIAGSVTTRTILLSFGILLFGIVGHILVSNKATMLQTEGGYETCAEKRIEIAEHMRYLPMGYFNANSLGYITSVTTNTMEQLGDIATRAIMLTSRGYLSTAMIVVMMFFCDWRVACVTLVGLLVFLLLNQCLQDASGRLAPVKAESDEALVEAVLEYIQGMQEVKAYSMTDRSDRKLRDAIQRCRQVSYTLEKKIIPWVGLQTLLLKLLGVVICGVSLRFFLDATMTVELCIMMMLCSFLMYTALDTAGTFSALMRHIDTSVDKAQEILDLETMDTNGKDLTPARCDLKADHISFAYAKDAGRNIINDVSLEIQEGTTTAIVGPSGGGKTTLCQLLARFWDVQSGEVTLGGVNLKDYSMDALMRNYSFVFQRVYLFEDTVANNIRFGRPDATMDEVVDAAKKACCHEFITALPEGYDTVIGEGGASLSGGEKQRISIARAILKDAPIIILDEATANVDPESERELMTAINALTRQKTILMIAHRLNTVRRADQILVVDQGKIVQRGTHEELLAQEGIYRRFVAERQEAVGWKLA